MHTSPRQADQTNINMQNAYTCEQHIHAKHKLISYGVYNRVYYTRRWLFFDYLQRIFVRSNMDFSNKDLLRERERERENEINIEHNTLFLFSTNVVRTKNQCNSFDTHKKNCMMIQHGMFARDDTD